MRMYDLIHKKKEGKALTKEEIDFFVKGVTDGTIPDCQTSALMMAVCLKGMDDREATDLTLAMLASGESADLSAIPGLKADKHSTGGVGDSTTPVVIPAVASCGLKVAKMSGRALGHTGGTIDKLESVPGTRVELTPEELLHKRELFVPPIRSFTLCAISPPPLKATLLLLPPLCQKSLPRVPML